MKTASPLPQPPIRRAAPRRLAALGWHTLVELHGCEARRLCGVRDVRRDVLQAVRAGGGTIVKDVFHAFSPWGVSGVVVITESHVTIHTWPEYGFAAVDLFTCGPTLDHRVIIEALRAAFRASRTEARRFRRGRNLTQMPTPAGNRDGVPRPARRVVGKKGKRP